ncbi:BBS9 [Mytilus coruscus]|uniref:BBS9 n=1 Tax=Mytilus coruscus TaxID=42192 RepID=A0A6J8C0B6_MYTCO|nr:BBS9 [Mytilus coruscus]
MKRGLGKDIDIKISRIEKPKDGVKTFAITTQATLEIELAEIIIYKTRRQCKSDEGHQCNNGTECTTAVNNAIPGSQAADDGFEDLWSNTDEETLKLQEKFQDHDTNTEKRPTSRSPSPKEKKLKSVVKSSVQNGRPINRDSGCEKAIQVRGLWKGLCPQQRLKNPHTRKTLGTRSVVQAFPYKRSPIRHEKAEYMAKCSVYDL